MYFYLKLFDYIEDCLGKQGYLGLQLDFLINRFSVYYHVLMGLYNISNITGEKIPVQGKMILTTKIPESVHQLY